jgi:hypothetical protein
MDALSPDPRNDRERVRLWPPAENFEASRYPLWMDMYATTRANLYATHPDENAFKPIPPFEEACCYDAPTKSRFYLGVG